MTRAVQLPLGRLVAITLLSASHSGMASDLPSHPDPNDSKLVERGKIVYEEQCANCHGEHLEGEPNWQRRKPNGELPAPPHDASGHTWHHSDV
jgi:hypothetical protein